MKDEDVHNLLGGFAAGILTDRERERLFAAALQDQKLFDTLADEEALRELLSDPIARREVLQAIKPARAGAWDRLAGWMRRPAYWAIAGGVVAALVIAVALRREKAPPVEIAQSMAPSESTLPSAGRNEPQLTPAPAMTPKTPEPGRRAMSAPSQVKEGEATKAAPEMLTKKLDETLQDKKQESNRLDAPAAASVSRSADAVIAGAIQTAPPTTEKDKATGTPGKFRPRDSSPAAPAVEATATAVDSQTANNQAIATSQRGSSQGAGLSGAVQSFGQQMQQKSQVKSQAKLTWSVTAVNATAVTLDGGSRAGLKVGDRLEVRRDSKPTGNIVITSVKDFLAIGEFNGDGPAKVGDTAAFPVSK